MIIAENIFTKEYDIIKGKGGGIVCDKRKEGWCKIYILWVVMRTYRRTDTNTYRVAT